MPGEEKELDSKEKEANRDKDVRIPLQLPPGTIIKSRWKLTSKIGQGAFGETYAGYDLNSPDGQQVAVKVERWDNKKMVLKLEVMALKKLQLCPYVVKYISSGRQDDFNFLVMERLGENLAELRKRTTCGAFSMGTTIRLGIQMLEAIEGCHNLSYIHRDVKPSNFVIGKSEAKRRRCYLIDFGLARKYRMPGGEIRPPRKSAGFRGTARYASVQSHQSKELSRRDDLWSLFYVLVEFASGSLPWRKVKDKDQIGELKEKHTNLELVKDLPAAFGLFMEHLQSLGYPTSPDYSYLRSLLQGILDAEGITPDTPYDWELPGSFARLSIASNHMPAQDTPACDKIDGADPPHADLAQEDSQRSQDRKGPGKNTPRISGISRDIADRAKGEPDPVAPIQHIDMAHKPSLDEQSAAMVPIHKPGSNASGVQTKAAEGKGNRDPEPQPQVVEGPVVAEPKPAHSPVSDAGKNTKGVVGTKGNNKGCRCIVM